MVPFGSFGCLSCSLPTGDITTSGDGETVIKVKFDILEATVTLQKGGSR